MASIDIKDASGKTSGTRDLPPAIFEAPVNVPLMHQVVVAAMAGKRAGTHKVKTRFEGRVSAPLRHRVVVAAMPGKRPGPHKVKTRGEVPAAAVKPGRQKGTG